jgi:hypothetical protein
VTLVFRDYENPGDSVTMVFETAAKKIRGYDVNKYLDALQEVVTLKQIQIQTTNPGSNKL